jgi:hypothetical protein
MRYLGQQTVINRCKANGHGNPYTKKEKEDMDKLSKKIDKLDRRVKLINILLIHW